MTHDSLFNPCNYLLHQDCNKICSDQLADTIIDIETDIGIRGKRKTSSKTLVLLAIAQNGGGGIWTLFNTADSRNAIGLYCSLSREE